MRRRTTQILLTVVLGLVLGLPWIVGASLGVTYWQDGSQAIGAHAATVFMCFAVLSGGLACMQAVYIVGFCAASADALLGQAIMCSHCWCCVSASVGLHQRTSAWVMWWWPAVVVFWACVLFAGVRGLRRAFKPGNENEDQYEDELLNLAVTNEWLLNNPSSL